MLMSDYWISLLRHSWMDWLHTGFDIFILYYLIFRLLLLFKGTRALSMAWAFVVIASAFFLANYFKLMTLEWVIGKFLQYAIIVVIVVFQHDIRRGLAKVGRWRILQRVTGVGGDDRRYEELVRAMVALASKNVGALVVLERNDSLDEYVDDGIPLDAKISKELVTSIFLTSSPIHDGAVIIQNDRMSAAGCVLPLTVNPNVSRTLGTRHRAAIGLTEETDAVAIVVSEEQGKISMVIDGKMTRDLDGTTLQRILQNLFSAPKKRMFQWPAEKGVDL